MLDGLLNRGFSSKCKSLMKATRTRIEVVRRRAEAKQRFLKEDLAKLLANGLDINAYGRVKQTEEFLAGLKLLSCYDFIEQSCDYVVKNLSNMQKLRECPEECREAVASLMFAAARISDLPELRDVRDLFQERYGSSLECFVNQKFVEKLAPRPSIMEKRLQLLQDIASEFSIKWDSRGFEQRMTTPAKTGQVQESKHGHANLTAHKGNLLDGKSCAAESDRHDVLPKEMLVGNIGHTMYDGREDNDLRRKEPDVNFYRRDERTNGHKQPRYKGISTAKDHNDIPFYEREQDIIGKHERRAKKDVTLSKVEKSGTSSYKKWLESSGVAYPDHDDVENEIHGKESWNPLSQEKANISPNFGAIPGKNEAILPAHEHGALRGKSDSILLARKDGNSQNGGNSPIQLLEEEVDGLKSYQNAPRPPPYVKSKSNAIPPPYVKPKDSKQKTSRRSEHAGSYCDEHPVSPPPQDRVDKVNGFGWSQKEVDNPVHEGQVNGLTRVRSHEKEHCYQDDQIPLPKPRSRRKHHKSSSSHDDTSHVEDSGIAKRSSGSRRRDHSQKGLQILMDIKHYRKDEEEKMIDKLLLHYSKKPSTYGYDVGKSRKSSQAHPSHQGTLSTGESSRDQDTNGYDVKPENIPPPTRSVSLPRGHSGSLEAKKIFARAKSFQPDNQARHVHPKLPDYDDLAARFTALKGR